MQIISAEAINQTLTWPIAIKALKNGHAFQRVKNHDSLIETADKKMLVRSAWIEGLAAGTKTVTIVPQNAPHPTIHGEVVLFDDKTGKPRAVLDGIAMTTWKTAADSALGSKLLSNESSEDFLMIGAGAMSEPLIRAHLSVRPGLRWITLWNRSRINAEKLKARLGDLKQLVKISDDLDKSVAQADIICSATMTSEPLIRGRYLKAGCHLDLVGAFTPYQREADDTAITRSRLFADSMDTTINDIGEFADPISRGIITKADIIADLYDLTKGFQGRHGDKDITLYKNGGGGHLDIMLAAVLADLIA